MRKETFDQYCFSIAKMIFQCSRRGSRSAVIALSERLLLHVEETQNLPLIPICRQILHEFKFATYKEFIVLQAYFLS